MTNNLVRYSLATVRLSKDLTRHPRLTELPRSGSPPMLAHRWAPDHYHIARGRSYGYLHVYLAGAASSYAASESDECYLRRRRESAP